MLPSSGYFITVMCPFSKLGLCTRPHCHYKHTKQDSMHKVSYSYSSARKCDEYVPENDPKTNSQAIYKSYQSEIDNCDEIATYVPTPVNKCIKPVGILKTSNSEKPSTSSIPEYKPTPIAKLKELNIVQSHVKSEYTPGYANSYRKKKNIEEYDPTEVKFIAPKKTVTFADDKLGTLFSPPEIVLSSDEEEIEDTSSAPKFSDDDFDDDIVICESVPKAPVQRDVEEVDVIEEEKIDEFSIVDKILVDSKKSDQLIKSFSKPKRFLSSDVSFKEKHLPELDDSLDSLSKYNEDDKDFDLETESARVDAAISDTDKCLEMLQSSLNRLEKRNIELNSSNSKLSKNEQPKTSKAEKSKDVSSDKNKNLKQSSKFKDTNSEDKDTKFLDKSKNTKTSDKHKSTKHDESVSNKNKLKDLSKKPVHGKNVKHSSESAQNKHTKCVSESNLANSKKKKVQKSEKVDKNHKPEKLNKSDKLSKEDKKHKSEKSDAICDKKHSSKLSAVKTDDKVQDRQVSSSSIVTKIRSEKNITNTSLGKHKNKGKSSPSKSSPLKRKSIDTDSKSNKVIREASPPLKKSRINSSSDEAPDIDVSLSSDEDIDAQLWEIYNETFSKSSDVESEEKEEQPQKKVHQEENLTSGKKRLAHAAASSLKKPPTITKVEAKKSLNPAQVMHNRYAQLQTMYAQQNKIPQSLLPPSRSNEKKRISYAPNPGLIAAVQQKKFQSENPSLNDFTPLPSTVTKTLKTAHRVAHVPDLAFKPRPIIPADFGSKVPVNVRQKFLNAFIDECLKFCSSEDEAYELGLDEEKKAYERSSSKSVYMNVAANTLKRLRDRVESQKSEVSTTTNSSKTSKKTVSHETVINGPIAQRTSFSVGKKRQTYDIKDFGGAALYEFLLSYIMTEEQLKENGYPFPHPHEPDRAVIEGIYANRIQYCNDAFKRTCSRCNKIYYVNVDGDYVRDEECDYHWGRMWKRRIAGAIESRYNCCQGDSESDGCCVGAGHVFEGSENHAFKGFVKTLPKTPPPDRCYGVYSLDCEMCYTTAGSELTRITVIGTDLKPVYESFVKPQNKVLDYNTRFSGITEDNLKNVRTSLHDVQAVLLCIFNDKTILIGHSLESDFKALKLFHNVVIDTSVVFPHKNGLPFKRALRTLMAEKLNKIIQNDVGGHDSHEDAAACMELLLWKIKEDLKSNR